MFGHGTGGDPVVGDTNAYYNRMDESEKAYDRTYDELDSSDFIDDAIKGDDLYNELIDQIPFELLVRGCVFGFIKNHADYLGTNYNESQGAIDGTEFRNQFFTAINNVIDHLKHEHTKRSLEA